MSFTSVNQAQARLNRSELAVPGWRVLSIRAEVEDHAPAGYSPIYQEYQVGDFECEFTLSGDFDPERIEARLSEGVLRLTIPRAEQPAARTIKITAGG